MRQDAITNVVSMKAYTYVAKLKWQCNLLFAICNSISHYIMQLTIHHKFLNTLFKVYFNMQTDNEILNKNCKSFQKINKNRITFCPIFWVPLFKLKSYSVPVIAMHFATLLVLRNSNYISIRKTLCKRFCNTLCKRISQPRLGGNLVTSSSDQLIIHDLVLGT